MRKFTVMFCALIGAVFVCIITVSLLANIKDTLYGSSVSSSSRDIFEGYYLTLHDGHIAIKSADDGSLVRLFDTGDIALSEYDKGLLTEGVFFSTLSDAICAAEDFIG